MFKVLDNHTGKEFDLPVNNKRNIEYWYVAKQKQNKQKYEGHLNKINFQSSGRRTYLRGDVARNDVLKSTI